jgi:putative DNA primase/helicase
MSKGAPDASGTRRERMEMYVDLHPETTVSELMGRFSLGPHEIDVAKAVVEGSNPGGEADETVPEWAREGDTGEQQADVPVADGSGSQIGEQSAADDTAETAAGGDAEGDADLTVPQIREHYERTRPVAEALGSIGDAHALGINDKWGWYLTRDGNPAAADGFDKIGRVLRFGADHDELVDRVERTLYATTSYKRPAAFDGQACTFVDDERVWRGDESATPDYADLRAVPAWGDVDLADDLKGERTGDGLDAETRRVAEETLAAYAEEVARLYDVDADAVHLLDSVGGAYVFGPPEATLPIVGAFGDDEDARERVMQALTDRMNAWLRKAEARVNDRVTGASDVVHPDWVNNVNRQYKAPLSLHGDTDAVVTPLDPASPDYDVTPVGDVDDELVSEATAWAESLTAPTHTGSVVSLVAHLWPDYSERCDGWRDALDAWVADERRAEAREEQRRQAERERREERREELAGRVADADATVTPFLQDVYDALDAVDVADVVEHHACDEWDTGRSTGGVTEFDPSWRSSSSGASCYVDHSAGTFGDSGEGGGGYAAKAMALGTGLISATTDDLNGETWREAVDALRSAGYDVPVWVPEAGSHRRDGETYEQMPLWALRRAAVALDVLPSTDAFVERESEDGGTYLGFPGAATYNRALAAVKEAGLDHGRERARGGSTPTRAELGLDEEPENDDEELGQILMEGALNARGNGA